MREDSQPQAAASSGCASQTVAGSAVQAPDSKASGGCSDAASSLSRRFWIALLFYAALAALAWFTLGEGSVLVAGKPVELRLIPLIIIGGLALRTVLARQAEKIRRGEH
jgi:hypothetical protein